ncbi:MAG: topoisomerase IV [Clostridiales bacterium]|jgi:DNA gyrase subunit A|nr:topoisomerase IV [Clostridiales bacterium]
MKKQEKKGDFSAQGPIIRQNISQTLELNYMPYAMSVILSRAIPEIDGFKPAHRKLLYTMYKMGLLTGARVKSADVVGQTMRLNPHGDAAIYETMVRLTRGNDALLHPFVDSKGNFGKQYSRDMAYAASRYTEVKLAEVCAEIFRDIDKDAVDFIDSYDARTTEPTLFPTSFPNLLVTPNQGIAVGMASCVPSFNLKEVCDLTIAYIKNKNCDVKKYMPAPDFSTGGEILRDDAALDAVYATGRGSLRLRAKYRVDEKNGLIEITEIPYTTTIEAIIDKIAVLVRQGKFREISDVRDETDINGLKIAIELRKNAEPEKTMRRLFSATTLSDSFPCNFNFLVSGRPRTVGILEILKHWLDFRRGVLGRALRFDLGRKRERLHLLLGLAKILLDIDKAIAIIRKTEEDAEVIPNLCAGFGIDEPQAEFVADIKLRNLNKNYILKQVAERENLEREIAETEAVLSSPEKIDGVISAQLKEISRKYGKPRRTQIVDSDGDYEEDPEEFIEDYPLRLFLTEHGYLKKISQASLRQTTEQYVKDDDRVAVEIDATNKSDIIFFSNQRNAYKLRAYEIPQHKGSALGEYLSNLLKLPAGEEIVFMAATTDYSGFILFVFDNGKTAKTPLSAYQTKMNRKKLLNAYGDKAGLFRAAFFTEDTDVVVVRDGDKALLLNTALVPLKTTRGSIGVQTVNFKRNSRITGFFRAEDFQAADAERYRAEKIPGSGHFLSEEDKLANRIERQLGL